MYVIRPGEAHRTGDEVMTRNFVDEPEHLVGVWPVARMPLRRRAQLDHVHRLASVELDEVAHPVTEGDEVPGLLREGVDDLAIRGFGLPPGHLPSLPEPGVDHRVWHLVPERRRQLLPLQREHAMAL